MEIFWIAGIVGIVALFMYIKQSKKDIKKERGELESENMVAVNNKGCSIAFYAFLVSLIIFFVYWYIRYRYSLEGA